MAGRQRRCGYCGEVGHTRRNCKVLHSRLKEQADAGSYMAEQQLKKLTQTKCSYCKEYGHNRRVCSARKTNITSVMGKVEKNLENITSHFAEVGIGLGALMTYEVQEWDNDKAQYVEQKYIAPVVKIHWDRTSHKSDVSNEKFDPSERFIEVRHMPRIQDGNSRGVDQKMLLAVPNEFWPVKPRGQEYYTYAPNSNLLSPAFNKVDSSIYSKANCRKMATAIIDYNYNRNKKR